MAYVLADNVREVSVTTGTGTYNLQGALGGSRTFVAGIGSGNLTDYFSTDGVDWEAGVGTVTDASPDTLARTLVLASSNGGSAVNWPAGAKIITCAAIVGRRNPRTRRLNARYTNATTTGTEVTGLELTNLHPGTYVAKFYLVVQSSAAATGIKFGVNFTGTAANIKLLMIYPTSGTAAANGTIDDVATTTQLVEHATASVLSTTAPNLGPTVGFVTVDVDCMIEITAIFDVTAVGNLELWGGAETANQISVEAGSAVILTRIDD